MGARDRSAGDRPCIAEQELERAWAAGFFDGEGCSTLSGRYLYLQVKQVDEYGIRRFHSAVGGFGNLRGPFKPKKETRSPIFIWRAGGRQAMAVMEILWPYLGPVKREQYERCFAFWDETRHGGSRCRRGHPFSIENTYVNPNTGERYCRTCQRTSWRRVSERKRAEGDAA